MAQVFEPGYAYMVIGGDVTDPQMADNQDRALAVRHLWLLVVFPENARWLGSGVRAEGRFK
jgi:hypothetical protein